MAALGEYLDSKENKCLFHSNEELRLFCEECQAVLCVNCLLEGHQKHDISKIIDVRRKLQVKLKELITTHTLTSFKDIIEMKKGLERELQECKDKEESVKDKLEKKQKDVLHSVRKIYDAQKEPLTKSMGVAEKTQDLLQKYNTILHSENNSTDLPICKIYQSLQFLFKTKLALSSGKTYGKSMPSLAEIHDHFKLAIPMIDSISKSSDEYREPSLPVTMTFPFGDIITKIVPLSVDSCWILAGVLYKLTGENFKQYPQVGKITDMAILNKKEILIIREDSHYIEILYEEKTVLKFTIVHPLRPICFSVVTPNKIELFAYYQCTIQDLCFDSNGIYNNSFKSVKINVEQNLHVDSVLVPDPENRYFLSCSDMGSCLTYDTTAKEEIPSSKPKYRTLQSEKSEKRPTSKFEGLHHGSRKSAVGTQFISYGMCHDPDGNVLLTDYHFNQLYLLNKKLIFQRVLLDHRSNLRNPAAVTVNDGHQNQVSIFQYSTVMNPEKNNS